MAAKVKESAVLTEGSLAVLARDVAIEKENGLIMAMFLNIPNTDIVNAANGASDVGLRNAADNLKIEVTLKLLLQWKRYRCGVKEKDKVRDLERALREIGFPEKADVINERHSSQQELTADAFSNLWIIFSSLIPHEAIE